MLILDTNTMTSHAKCKTLLPGKKRISSKRKMDFNKALILRAKGNSYRDIAKQVGVSNGSVVRSAINNFLNALPDTDQLNRLDKLKIPVLKASLGNLLVAMNDPNKIQKASLNNAAYALTQVHTALRLEEGKSTSNVSYADTLRALKLAKEELRMLNESNGQVSGAEPQESFTIPIIQEGEESHGVMGE